MINENKLRAAAEASCNAEMAAVEEALDKTQPHVFSPAFEKEIKKLSLGPDDDSSQCESAAAL